MRDMREPRGGQKWGQGMARTPIKGMAGLLRELAEWEENCWPLRGTDVMNFLIEAGFTTKVACEEALKEHAPEAWAAHKAPKLRRKAKGSRKKHDDEIPF